MQQCWQLAAGNAALTDPLAGTPPLRACLPVCLQKAAALKRARDMEEQRDAALADALRWRQQLEAEQQLAAQAQPLAQPPEASVLTPAAAVAAPLQHAGPSQPDVTAQLAALQQHLECLAAEGSSLPQLQQERARMSICLQTIKELTDMVRQSAAASPSGSGSPSLDGGLPAPKAGGPSPVADAGGVLPLGSGLVKYADQAGAHSR